MSAGYRTLHLDDIPTVRVPDPGVPAWKPVRRELGIQAFGTNAYVAASAGDVVIEPHDELPRAGEPAGHQEIYLVLDGVARFTVDGESFDVRTGGIVFLEDPSLHRQAVALEAGTVVFAVGGPAGEVFVPSPWEDEFYAEGTTSPE
jgi:quercetin dioxygenase-like cupin family protein